MLLPTSPKDDLTRSSQLPAMPISPFEPGFIIAQGRRGPALTPPGVGSNIAHGQGFREGAEGNHFISGRQAGNRPVRWERVEPMDEQLKRMMKDLGEAINETLSSSESISGAIATIRNSGYDVFLVLEATIGFNKRSEESPEEPVLAESDEVEARLNITSQDIKFLKSLKISVEESESQ